MNTNYTGDMDCPDVPRNVLVKRLRDKKDDPKIRKMAAKQLERDSFIIHELRIKLYGAKAKTLMLEEQVEKLSGGVEP